MSRLAANTVQVGFTVLLAVAALFAHGGALAADPTPGAQPRIGLALSGGGARGIAHVGVLKVLEEMRIPVHCVTGASMGSIVGGAFAAGTPPSKLEQIVLEANWNEIFRDQPPRDEISMRRKADDYKTLFAPELGLKDGSLALPKGLVAGVSIEGFFRVLGEPASGIDDFSKLPIPFRAMATDIETGDSVVLDRGSIAQAMRASMAVPGALAPVEINGRLLVDGGIANNLPIDEARKLCADVVIAVNISTPPLKRDELTSALSVTGQLINFLGKQTVDQQLKSMGSGDVLIQPGLGDITAGSFERAADAIRIGEEATRAMAASTGALQRLTRTVCGAARDAGRLAQVARYRRRDPLRGIAAHQPRSAASAGGEQARRAADRGEDQRRPAPHLRPRGLREHRLSHGRRKRRPARNGHHTAGEIVGAGLLAVRRRPRQRLPRRQRLQRSRPVSQVVAQSAGRRVADGSPGRAGHTSLLRVLPAAARARRMVRLALRRGRAGVARRVQR